MSNVYPPLCQSIDFTVTIEYNENTGQLYAKLII